MAQKFINPETPEQNAYNEGWDDASKGVTKSQYANTNPILYDWWECGWVDNPDSISLVEAM